MIDMAIPCGLIINELISNSFKHAFPGSRTGVISIKFKRIDGDSLELLVSDNGIGVAEDFDFYSEQKMGLMIVFNIGEKQLSGNVKFISDNGIKCIIRFKDDSYIKRV
jgi:two-component sensor histidine kinase